MQKFFNNQKYIINETSEEFNKNEVGKNAFIFSFKKYFPFFIILSNSLIKSYFQVLGRL